MDKQNHHPHTRDYSANKVAEITGHTPDSIRRIRNGKWDNDLVIGAALDFKNGEKQLVENLKSKQELYMKLQKSGRWEQIAEVEEAIDRLQAAYQELYKNTLTDFEDRVCA